MRVELNREKFREIKGFTKEQMENYLTNLFVAASNSIPEGYEEVYEKGASDQNAFVLSSVSILLKSEFGMTDEQTDNFLLKLKEVMMGEKEVRSQSEDGVLIEN